MGTFEDKIEILLESVLDGSCSNAERRVFYQLTQQHPQLMDGLIDQIVIHGLLLQWRAATELDRRAASSSKRFFQGLHRA